MQTESALKVVELGDSVRTGYCGLLLAHLGAQVTKVTSCEVGQTPAVDDVPALRRAVASAYLDRPKTIVTAKDTAPAELMSMADVVLAPSSEQFTQMGGLSPTDFCERYPAAVVGIATMLGEQGRYTDMVGHEAQALALGGLLSMVGQPGREPLRLGGPQAEHSAGLALLSAVSVLVFQRSTTGRGGLARTSAVRAAAYIDWKSQAHYADDRTILERGSTSGPIVLRCGDGFVGFYYRDEEWEAVKRLVGDARLDDPRFLTQQLRDEHRAQLVAILEEFSMARSREEVCLGAQALGVPAGSVLSVGELVDDPQLRSRDLLHEVEVPGLGRFVEPAAPWVVDGERQALA